jgi:hypothetical protein
MLGSDKRFSWQSLRLHLLVGCFLVAMVVESSFCQEQILIVASAQSIMFKHKKADHHLLLEME